MTKQNETQQAPVNDPLNLCDGAVLLTAKQAAGKLGIAVRTFKRRLAGNQFLELRVVRDGARILRFHCQDLGRLIERLSGGNHA